MRKKQFELLEIEVSNHDQYKLPYHSHTYYEIIYVQQGHGNYKVNDLFSNYETGDLFLISPEDMHQFFYDVPTTLIFIKFTENYFHKFPAEISFPNHRNPLNIMRSKFLKEEKLVFTPINKGLLLKTIENIAEFAESKDPASSPFLYFQILSILGLIQETSVRMNIRIDNGNPDKEELITYIHQNIYNPEKIKIKQITNHFHISANYFSNYFKRNFNISFRQYITDYRMKLIENRLTSGKQSINEIAIEFGFADTSHFSNYFKAQKNITPNAYRKNQQDRNTIHNLS